MRIRRVSRLGLGRNVKLRVDACRFGYGCPDIGTDGLRCDQAGSQEASSLIFQNLPAHFSSGRILSFPYSQEEVKEGHRWIPVGGYLTTYSYNSSTGSLTALSLDTGDALAGSWWRMRSEYHLM